ncbi:hypothetical protein EDD21DRAFT_193702 [Dissophora ornata]|nr:hypothetical protein EDD21DRAFT_193702 [Dissophora ornata]
MVSVGVLVKPSADTGRCGQVWRHVAFLKSQAKHHAVQDSEPTDLDDYFERHKTLHPATGPSSSCTSKRDSYRAHITRRISRSFTLSEPVHAFLHSSTGRQEFSETDDIPPSHPSHHFLRLVQTMGPSVYSLWKAALLKKRILIYTPLPIEAACLSVYNICLMATIPSGATSIPPGRSSERIQPLFCVGIYDIDHMSDIRGGYVACTTDKLFLSKPQLYDVLVDLSAASNPRIQHTRRTLQGYEGEDFHPNAMDNRRYFTLLQQLGKYRRRQEWMQRRLYAEAASSGIVDEDEESGEPVSMERPEISKASDSVMHPTATGFNMSDTLGKMLTGGWWWWYGGDDNDAESEDFEPLIPRGTIQNEEHESPDGDRPLSGARLQVLQTQTSSSSDTEAIRFFHNLTSTLLSELGRLIYFKATAAIFEDVEPLTARADESGSSRQVEISKQDMRQLGLDPCKDSGFVDELGRLYFGSGVRLQDSGLVNWCRSLCSCGCGSSCCYSGHS